MGKKIIIIFIYLTGQNRGLSGLKNIWPVIMTGDLLFVILSLAQPRLDNLLPPTTTFSKTVFLLVPDSVKRKLVSNSPGLVDLDWASEFSS